MNQQNAIIQLTDSAVAHIKKIMTRKPNGVGFRLTVKQTGCSGYMYVPEIVESVNADDVEVLAQDLRVFIDPKWTFIFKGTVIDYVPKGMGETMLVFNNPNVDTTCGCGESFNLKEDVA